MPTYRLFVQVTALVTLCVIVLGAWVRLTDAGLGCPDWPGCYGQITWPRSEASVEAALQNWAVQDVDSGKAFREMVHRYVAGLLGLMVLWIALWSWRRRQRPGQPVVLPMLILALVIFQAVLGMWTVTLQLKPVIVLAHLVGGLATFALLVWLSLRCHHHEYRPPLHHRLHRPLVVLAMGLLIGQILLGGWVSTNYAALACPDVPTCGGQWWPQTNFREGFKIWRGIGVDYEGGVLDQPSRVAIHLSHRIGAVLVLVLFTVLSVRLIRTDGLAALGVTLGALVLAQWLIGLYNVIGGLPLINAVAHNGMAAVLLAMMVVLLHRSSVKRAR